MRGKLLEALAESLPTKRPVGAIEPMQKTTVMPLEYGVIRLRSLQSSFVKPKIASKQMRYFTLRIGTGCCSVSSMTWATPLRTGNRVARGPGGLVVSYENTLDQLDCTAAAIV